MNKIQAFWILVVVGIVVGEWIGPNAYYRGYLYPRLGADERPLMARKPTFEAYPIDSNGLFYGSLKTVSAGGCRFGLPPAYRRMAGGGGDSAVFGTGPDDRVAFSTAPSLDASDALRRFLGAGDAYSLYQAIYAATDEGWITFKQAVLLYLKASIISRVGGASDVSEFRAGKNEGFVYRMQAETYEIFFEGGPIGIMTFDSKALTEPERYAIVSSLACR